MPKFVLIDHSICDLGGHYYEYAARVLHAAKDAGYEPILATNKKFQAPHPLPWELLPVYRYDFFQPDPPRVARTVFGNLRKLRGWVERWKCRLLFSPAAVLWFRRRHGGLSGQLESRSWLLFVAATVGETCLYLARLCKAAVRLCLSAALLEDYPRKAYGALRQFWDVVAWPWRSLVARKWVLWGHLHRWRKRTAFAADSISLFKQVELDDGDLVFIPTLTEIDMLGLLTLFRTNADTAKATWHLIFRRNIYQGREPDYANQDESLRPLRNAFRRFLEQLSDQRVHFYTDTEALTAQYDRLSATAFSTVPIPIAADYRASYGEQPASAADKQVTAQRQCHVVYIGDARTEKGYPWLPHLVGDAVAHELPLRFTFQSNFNVPGGEPAAAVARWQLEALPPEQQVRLLTQPLPSREYRQLLFDADVVVIPYERDNYYARSSGIFAEALVAGKPVLVPAGTWMAVEMSSAIRDYHHSLTTRHPVLATLEARDLVWRAGARKHLFDRHGPSDEALPIGGRAPTRCWQQPPAGATHLVISFRLSGPTRGIFPGMVVEQFGRGRSPLGKAVSVVGGGDDPRGSMLVPLEAGVRRLRVELNNSMADTPLELNDVRFHYLSADEALPLSVVGTIYTETHELAAWLREMARHYDHYRATAVMFSRVWSDYHCAELLVSQLSAAAGARWQRPVSLPAGGVATGLTGGYAAEAA